MRLLDGSTRYSGDVEEKAMMAPQIQSHTLTRKISRGEAN